MSLSPGTLWYGMCDRAGCRAFIAPLPHWDPHPDGPSRHMFAGRADVIQRGQDLGWQFSDEGDWCPDHRPQKPPSDVVEIDLLSLIDNKGAA